MRGILPSIRENEASVDDVSVRFGVAERSGVRGGGVDSARFCCCLFEEVNVPFSLQLSCFVLGVFAVVVVDRARLGDARIRSVDTLLGVVVTFVLWPSGSISSIFPGRLSDRRNDLGFVGGFPDPMWPTVVSIDLRRESDSGIDLLLRNDTRDNCCDKIHFAFFLL